MAAADLSPQDDIASLDGSYGDLTAIRIQHAPQRMLNLTVADAHTFAVGVGRWVVHNTCIPQLRPSSNPTKYADLVDSYGRGLGNLIGMEADVTLEGLEKIKQHLEAAPYLSPDAMDFAPNRIMLQSLESALVRGVPIEGAELSFYLHEITESEIGEALIRQNPTLGAILEQNPLVDRYNDINRSLSHLTLSELKVQDFELWQAAVYQYSHQASLARFNVSEFSVYSVEAARAASLPPVFVRFWEGN